MSRVWWCTSRVCVVQRVCVCRQVHILVSSDAHFRRSDDDFLHRPGGGVPPVCLVVCVSCVWVSGGAHFVVRRCTFGRSGGHFFDDFGRPDDHFGGSGWSFFRRFWPKKWSFFAIFGSLGPVWGGYPKTPKNGFLERFRRLDGFSVAFLAKIWCPPPPSGGHHIWGSGPPKMGSRRTHFWTILGRFFDHFWSFWTPKMSIFSRFLSKK